jgi:hypothetical protein
MRRTHEEHACLGPPRAEDLVNRQGRKQMAARPSTRDHDTHQHPSGTPARRAMKHRETKTDNRPARILHEGFVNNPG